MRSTSRSTSTCTTRGTTSSSNRESGHAGADRAHLPGPHRGEFAPGSGRNGTEQTGTPPALERVAHTPASPPSRPDGRLFFFSPTIAGVPDESIYFAFASGRKARPLSGAELEALARNGEVAPRTRLEERHGGVAEGLGLRRLRLSLPEADEEPLLEVSGIRPPPPTPAAPSSHSSHPDLHRRRRSPYPQGLGADAAASPAGPSSTARS